MKLPLKITTVLFAFLAIGLASVLAYRIHNKSEEKKLVKQVEKAVKTKLLAIRDAEKGYKLKYGKFTGSWDTLTNFVLNDNFFIVEKREEVIPLGYGRDSIVVHLDTLGSISIRDTLLSKEKYPNLKLENLKYLPHNPDKEFDLYVNELDGLSVIEVKDTEPINPERQEGGTMEPLKFGSTTEATLKANWEK